MYRKAGMMSSSSGSEGAGDTATLRGGETDDPGVRVGDLAFREEDASPRTGDTDEVAVREVDPETGSSPSGGLVMILLNDRE
jgi:hypothetical protein